MSAFDEWYEEVYTFCNRLMQPARGPSRETRRRLREAILALLDEKPYDDHNVLITSENHVTAIVQANACDALMARLAKARTPAIANITKVQPPYWRSYEVTIYFAERPRHN